MTGILFDADGVMRIGGFPGETHNVAIGFATFGSNHMPGTRLVPKDNVSKLEIINSFDTTL